MNRLFAAVTVIAFVVGFAGCGAKVEKPSKSGDDSGQARISGFSRGEVRFVQDDTVSGMRLVLREAKSFAGGNAQNLPVLDAENLNAKQTNKLLSRVDALKAAHKDRKNFAFKKGSTPPPRTGETVDVSFPPSTDKAAPVLGKPGKLEIIRFAPKGDVPIVPHMSITFSKPMTAVTSQAEASKITPARLSPLPAGDWRWLGSRTLLFKPVVRFPMATDYTVTVPGGTVSANGDKLEKTLTFSFGTPPPTVKDSYPSGRARPLNQIIFIEFDQKIRAEQLLKYIELNAGGDLLKIRPATETEIADDEYVRNKVRDAEEGRWVAIAAQKPLPMATEFNVKVKKGTPSAEGPKTSTSEHSFKFYTYDPLKITASRCGWRNHECSPTDDWNIDFNNALDSEDFDPSQIKVAPSFPGMIVNLWGDTISINGFKKGRTKYTVTIPAATKDRFGQTLKKDEQITFEVGPARKTLFGPGKDLITLEPSGPPAVAVHSVNHKKLKVTINRVVPETWFEWVKWRNNYRYKDAKLGPMPGKRVFNKNIKVKGEKDSLTQTLIDLKPYLNGGHGQFIVKVEPYKRSKDRYARQEIMLWVQVTDLAVSAFVDNDEMLTWTTALKNGAPIDGASLSLLSKEKSITTSKSDNVGLARIKLKKDEYGEILVAKLKSDAVILPESNGSWNGGGWSRIEQRDSMRWFTFDDRGIYRPGERVHVKGWIRKFETGPGGDITALKNMPPKISWVLRGPRGNDLKKGNTKISRLGGFDLEMMLPKNVNLGWARLSLTASGVNVSDNTYEHSFKVEEFRRPEFEVTSKAEPGPYFLGEEVVTSVTAAYYAGGSLQNAPVNWRVWATKANYVPPNADEYSFGEWNPWWRHFDNSNEGRQENLNGKTDGAGEHHLAIHFESVNPIAPMTVTAEATVEDVNRQAWTTSEKLLVHPSSLYIGLKSAKNFYDAGDEIKIESLVVDVEGRAISGVEAQIKMVRLSSVWKKGKWTQTFLDPVDCVVTSAAEAKVCVFKPEVGGRYLVEATVEDDLGRKNETKTRLWISGGDTPPSRNVDQDKLTLVPEQEEYQPGDTARFLLESPFYPAEGLLTIRRSGLISEKRFTVTGPGKEFEIPITQEHIPNFTVQVDLAGAVDRTDDFGKLLKDAPKRPAYATGNLIFKVPPMLRTLRVSARPAQTMLAPGKGTTIDLTVKDANGNPVQNAELAVWVADESVLALSGYKLPDPLSVFYSARYPKVSDYHSRQQIILADSKTLNENAMSVAAAGDTMDLEAANFGGGVKHGMKRTMIKSAPMPMPMSPRSAVKSVVKEEAYAIDDDINGANLAISLRSNFNALALFAPEVKTDNHGNASVKVNLPDSLTRYRVMVVAVGGDKKFGSSEANITARLPLMVRPSPPRFLNFGDRFELPVVLQNQTDKSMEVKVAVRATNLSFADSMAKTNFKAGNSEPQSFGKKVTVPANDRVEVRFAAAAQMAGTARFQVVATSAGGTDAAEFNLPVWTPATSEAFATYGQIDKGSIAQPIATPKNVWTQFGGLEITTSSTQLQALTDAVLYLVKYRFDCNEQKASRILAIAGLRDVLAAFESEQLPTPKELADSVNDDLKHLAARQNRNGGFAFWRRGDRDWPYLSVHVANAMARAKKKGYKISERMWSRSNRYLNRIKQHIPSWYSKESKWAIRAYALNTLRLMGKIDGDKALELLKEAGLKNISLEALGWILPVLHDYKATDKTEEVLRRINNSVTETASGAHFVTRYSDGAHVLLHSSRRADGILLESLIEVAPKNDLIPKLVKGLLAHRVKGKWSNTQENAFVLLAMDRYFNVFEKITPNFVASVWLGDGFAGEHKFKGRTTERALINVPMSFLSKRKRQDLTLQKSGEGRLYYRIGMRYAPQNLSLKAADFGFAIDRTYESIDNPKDVTRDDSGVWHIKAGARVRVKLTMVTPMRRYHVALVDPLPAGMEPVNPTLAVTGGIPEDPKSPATDHYWWWFRPWYEHQNMRDERVEAFTSLLWEGVHNYSYVAKATTPGEFVVPPSKAEEMYTPETFGRTASDKVIIK